MKKISRFLLLLLALNTNAKADEGMWLLPLLKQLNEADMQALGMQLTTEDIYSVNHSGLKDAIMIFGGGCTGEFISPEGLLLTNHHCGYGVIQQHSAVENDYLKNGFWAKDRASEIASPGLSIKLLHRIDDVTSQVLLHLTDTMSEEVRQDSIMTAIQSLKKDEDSTLLVSIKPFFSGNAYYRLAYREYKDVRLVGAPPSSIGKFGADTDNWMWPRHTGDFSLFRVYAAPDGSPAEYAERNVPFQPKQHLKISMKGAQNNDFAMIIGFPGSTNRYLNARGIEQRMQIHNQTLIDVRGVKQKIWLEDMQKDREVNIKYASKYARSSNYYKNSIGMNRQLKRLKVLEQKRALEAEFQAWADATPERNSEYGTVLEKLNRAYEKREADYARAIYIRETLLSGIELFRFALKAESLEKLLQNKDDNKDESPIIKAVNTLREDAEVFYKNYHAATDQRTSTAMLQLFQRGPGEDAMPIFFTRIKRKHKNEEAYTARLFAKSIFADKAKLMAFLDNPQASKLTKDPALIGAKAVQAAYNETMKRLSLHKQEISAGQRLFEKGLHEMLSHKKFYPDANFTMRLSYGTVGDYKPADGVHYDYYTTLKGVMEKENPESWEFQVPHKLKELYETQNYGKYADADGTLHVCFITNNDITGGNSGSPVLNAKGELFGLAFDSNWEGMSGDIAFEPYLQRVVNVDIRYILFIIDKFADAGYLISEMELVP